MDKKANELKTPNNNSGGDTNNINNINNNIESARSDAPPLLPREIEISIVDVKTADTQNITIKDYTELEKLILTETLAPAVFSPNRRKQPNVSKADCFFLDIEDGTTPEMVKEILDQRGLLYVISLTRNHMLYKKGKPPVPRMRVYLQFDKTIEDKADLVSIIKGLGVEFPMTDHSTTETARQFFSSKKIYAANYTGKLLDTANLLKLGRSKNKKINKSELEIVKNPEGARLKLPSRALEFMHYGAAEGSWNPALFQAACDFRDCNYTYDETVEELSKMQNEFYSGMLDDKDLNTISSAFKYEIRQVVQNQDVKAEDIWQLTKTERNIQDSIIDVMGNMPYFNEMKETIYFGPEIITDEHMSKIRHELRRKEELTRMYKNVQSQDIEKYVAKINSDVIDDAIVVFAKKNSYHPFKQYIESCAWDQNIDYIGELFNRAIILRDQFKQYAPFYEIAFRKFFVGLVRRVYKKGSRQFCIVFQGGQGKNKSFFFDGLCPVEGSMFIGQVDPYNKDHLAYHAEFVLGHLSELDGITSKTHAAALKNYIDISKATYRRPYGRYNRQGYSQLSFVGSCNKTAFLNDPTGSRRFVVFGIDSVNEKHNVNLQQVYAQAFHLYSENFQCWLTKEEEAVRDEINAYFSEELVSDSIVNHLEAIEDNDYNNWLSLDEIIKKSLMEKIVQAPPNKSELESVIQMKLKVFKDRPNPKSAFKFPVRFKEV